MPRRALTIVSVLCIAAATTAGQDPDTLSSLTEGLYTEAQARRGALVYEQACGSCHMTEYFTDTFLDSWTGAPVSMLFELVRTTMPEDRPGSLESDGYADVLAYIFQLNGLPSGERELPARLDELEKILIERRD